MRRFLFGIAIASLTASVPSVVLGGDQEIADAIVSTLNQHQVDGSLKGFDIDIGVESGKVLLTGHVSTEDQMQSVLKAAHSVTGVREVDNQIEINKPAPVAPPNKMVGKLPFSLREAISNPDYATDYFGRTGAKSPPLSTPPAVTPASNIEQAPVEQLAEPLRLVADETSVSPQDAAITDSVISRIAVEQKAGKLRLFQVEVSTVKKEVWVRGHTANASQKDLILQCIQRTPGVVQIVDDITVKGSDSVRPASAQQQGSSMPVAVAQAPVPVAQAPVPVAQAPVPVAQAPVVSAPAMAPRPFAPSMLASNGGEAYSQGAGPAPVPMQGSPASYGPGVPRYDQPAMPNYAWPSYAAHPNYAAVTYPKQYSASAWPYIGPFYPYPQVPLGWRKVSLEWDDGLWYLDFTSKR